MGPLHISLPSVLPICVVAVSVMLSSCERREREEGAPPAERQPSGQVHLRSGPLAVDRGIDSAVAERLQRTDRRSVPMVLQLERQPSIEEHRELRQSGVQLHEYLGSNAYLATVARRSTLTAGPVAAVIRSAKPIRPQDKLAPGLARRSLAPWAVDSATGQARLLVTFFPDVDTSAVRADLRSVGVQGRRYGAGNTWAVAVNPDVISRLAGLESVKFVQEGPMPFLPLTMNEGGRRVANTDEAQQSTFNTPQPAYRNVSGNGIQIGICDAGVDENHNDFLGINAAGQAAGTRVYNVRAGSGSHGTHVASIAAGNGINSVANGFPAFSLRGHAPRAQVGDYPSFGSNAQSFYDAIVTGGTEVTNHSYVQSLSVYDTEASGLDIIVRGDGVDNNSNPIPQQPQVWAAGNNGFAAQYGDEEGYYAVFTSAKNTISVGSVDTRDGRLSRFSSLGPTFDGRIKPDVMAPGCLDALAGGGIQAASNNTQGYTGKCGTSMAAPAVSGIIGLLMEQFQNGGGVVANVLPSSYKAILVHTAKDVVKPEAYDAREFDNPDVQGAVLSPVGPDFATGFGLVDAGGARSKIGNTGMWREASLGAAAAEHIYCISVPAGVDEIKAVIAWDDEPGSTLTTETTAKLVNDLDLVLEDPDGNSYQPWTLNSLPLTAQPGDGARDPIGVGDLVAATRGADRRNNVEMASVHRPKAGLWRAKVRAFALPTGNAQPYSFVSSHKVSVCLNPGFNLCRLIPWLCPRVNLCKRYPWICEGLQKIPEPFFDRGSWFIDPRQPLPINKICQYVVNCPGCRGAGWSYCPGFDVVIDQLPKDAVVTMFDDRGEVVLTDSTAAGARTLRLERRNPGAGYFLAFTNKAGDPYGKMLKLRLNLKSLGRSPGAGKPDTVGADR
jgi:subtilisin family serine protease